MRRYIDKYEMKIQLLFKSLFLIHLLFSINILLVGTAVSKLVMVASVFVGFILLITRLFDFKQILFSFEGAVLLVFMVSYVVSVILNIQYGYISGIKYFIWFSLLMGGVFWINRKNSRREVYREMLLLSIVLIVVTTITNIINIGLLLDKYNCFYPGADGNHYLMGFADWGRLYGIYTDPNYGAVISCAAVIAAVFCFFSVRKTVWKGLLAISVIPNLFYCSFSASRTGKLALMIGSAVIVFVYLLRKCGKMYLLKSAAAAVLVAVVAFGVFDGVQVGYNTIQYYLVEKEESPSDKNNSEQPGESEKPGVKPIGRTEEELQGDISNRRFDIWKSGFNIFKKNPVFGIGWNNTVAYIQKNMPDSYMLGTVNNLADFDIFHNSFIDVFVFQGIFGGVIMIALMLYVLVLLIKKLISRKYEPWFFAMAVATVILCVFSGCVLSVLVYFNNPISYLFWLCLGYVMYFCKTEEEI